MGAAELARPHQGAASSDQRHQRGAVMWGPHRRPADQNPGRQRDPGGRVDSRDFKGRPDLEQWEETRQPLGQHRLARTRRPDEQEMVAARGGYLHGQSPEVLPSYVRKIRGRRPFGLCHHVGADLRPALVTSDDGDKGTKAGRTPNRASADERSLRGARRRDDHESVWNGIDERQYPRHPPDAAVQSQLTEERQAREPVSGELPVGSQQRHGDGEVESRPALADTRRRQIDRDPALWPAQSARQHGGSNPVPRFPARRVRKADHRKGRDPRGDVHLDRDRPSLDANQSGGWHAGKHYDPPGRATYKGRPPATERARGTVSRGWDCVCRRLQSTRDRCRRPRVCVFLSPHTWDQ